MLAACILTGEPVVLHNVPDISDVHSMMDLLRQLGISLGIRRTAFVENPCRRRPSRPISIRNPCRRMRASILLAGPMLGAQGENPPAHSGRRFHRPPPGRHAHSGAAGARRGSLLPTNVRYESGRLDRRRTSCWTKPASRRRKTPIMASVLAKGNTIIRNAASEPHVQDLCTFLNSLGAKILHIGSNVLKIEGVKDLHGGEYTLGADYLEVASFIGAAAVTGGEDPHPQRPTGTSGDEPARLPTARRGLGSGRRRISSFRPIRKW